MDGGHATKGCRRARVVQARSLACSVSDDSCRREKNSSSQASVMRRANGVMECWSIGFHHSNTPTLHYSNHPFVGRRKLRHSTRLPPYLGSYERRGRFSRTCTVTPRSFCPQ
jgi:hypothetical protein